MAIKSIGGRLFISIALTWVSKVTPYCERKRRRWREGERGGRGGERR